MSAETVMKDRKIASKRVDIERIIGLGKTYKILFQPLTPTESSLSTQIITVCFLLCNFRPCIVSHNACYQTIISSCTMANCCFM